MKKLILTVALVMATGSVIIAKSDIETVKSIEDKANDCADEAWDYGSDYPEERQYERTNWYYTYYCE